MQEITLNTPSQAGASEETNAHVEQVAKLLALWSRLDTTGLTAEALTLQPLLAGNGRFVTSLARQYQNQSVSQEVLVTAAHGALIILLNQYAGRPDKLDKLIPLALRNAMVAVVEMPDGPHHQP